MGSTGVSFGTRWKGVFCFFWCLDDAGIEGEGERLRFGGPFVTESDDEVAAEVEMLVLAVEVFWTEVA